MTPKNIDAKQLIEKLRKSGFTLERLEHGYFKITPSQNLTNEQRQFLTAHAEAITNELLNNP